MHRICATLAENGFDVRLVGRLLPGSQPLKEFPFSTTRLKCFFNKGKLFYLEFNLRLLLYLLFNPYDIFGAVDLDTILPNLIAAKLKGKKLTYDAHEYFTEVPEVVNRPAVRKVWKAVERFSVPRVDAASTVGRSLAELFQKDYAVTFHVIRNVPLRQTEHTNAPGEFLLYQGALNEGRGLEALLEAMTELDCKLIIAGEGDLGETLREYSKALNLGSKVSFTGRLDPEELRHLTRRAFLGYNVLENKGLSYYYSLANKCFDYVQAGVPVLCSKFPEYLVLSEEYPVFIFAAPEKNSIVKAVKQYLSDKTQAESLRQQCFIAAEKWNWEQEKKELTSMYEKLI